MKMQRRSPHKGTTILKYILIVLFIITIVISIWMYCKLKQYTKAIAEMDSLIIEKSNDIENLKTQNDNLENTILELKKHCVLIEENNLALKQGNSELIEKNAQLENEIKNNQPVETIDNKDFKSYMPYTAITDVSSIQYQLQQSATTDENGIRTLNSRPMVAIGSGWGIDVGDSALIICENGNSFEIIVGDIKADVHTDSENKTTIANGCRCEFIVDMNTLNPTVQCMGNVAVLEEYNGYIVDIVKQ